MTRRSSTFKQRDLTRGVKAFKMAGFTARVDILRDGTLRFTPMTPEAQAPETLETNEWDRVLGKSAVRS